MYVGKSVLNTKLSWRRGKAIINAQVLLPDPFDLAVGGWCLREEFLSGIQELKLWFINIGDGVGLMILVHPRSVSHDFFRRHFILLPPG